ncbi:MAG: hypothetical protein AAFY20_27250 [Cyanobacteria bacterium J06639_14]
MPKEKKKLLQARIPASTLAWIESLPKKDSAHYLRQAIAAIAQPTFNAPRKIPIQNAEMDLQRLENCDRDKWPSPNQGKRNSKTHSQAPKKWSGVGVEPGNHSRLIISFVMSASSTIAVAAIAQRKYLPPRYL